MNTQEKLLIDRNIESLNLNLIKMKLADLEDGENWTLDECKSVEIEYKRFLQLKKLYPEKEIVPSKPIDTFWHYHILDTKKYYQDCLQIFGEFMHHFPYFGMNGPDDYQSLCDAFETTSKLYKEHFDSDYSCGSVRCRTACKPVKCK